MYKKELLNKKGFTLIELLAVLVILAVISLITAPIVINLIDESKQSAKLVAARNYLKSAESELSLITLNSGVVDDGTFPISKDGEICLYGMKDNKCLGNIDDIISLDITGEKPKKGYETISSGNITNIDLYYEDLILSKTGNSDFFVPTYKVGQQIKFNPGPAEFTWNVVSETDDTVMLLLNQNLPKSLNTTTLFNIQYDQIFDELCKMDTTSFTNVDYIKNFSYSNSQGVYKNIEIRNGNVTITNDADEKRVVPGKTKMRILTFEEVYRIILMSDPNAAYELSDAKLDDELEFVLDSNGLTLEDAEAMGIRTWDDARNMLMGPEVGLETFSRRDVQITNIHMILYSEAGIFSDPNVNFPSWLASNLDSQVTGSHWYYALLTSLGNGMYATIDDSPSVMLNTINYPTGIRPVIEVSKDKLK